MANLKSLAATALLAMISLIALTNCDEIKLESIDPKKLNMQTINFRDGTNTMGGKAFDVSQINKVIVKIHFRDKYLKKSGAYELSAEMEEILGEEEVDYQNFNVKDEKYIWMLCNDGGERERIKDILTQKEFTLVVEADGKRFFGKYASKEEKDTWRANNKKDPSKKIDL